MAANSSPSTPISINQLVLLAYKRAGVLPVEAKLSGANMVPKLEHGRQTLDLILDGLATEGFIARTTHFYDLALSVGVNEYTLPDTILDVFETAMFIPDDTNDDTELTTGEMPCTQVDVSTWQTLSTKGSTSTRPTLYASFRESATIVLRFWPVPSAAGTMRLKTIRLLGSNSDGTKNLDLQRYWQDAIVWLLAYYIAVDSSMPLDKVQMLQMTAEAKKRACVSYSFEHTGTQAYVSYQTQWSS